MSFITDYFGIMEESGDQAVFCPFDHYTGNGVPYKESHASAHVNTNENLFHCKACSKGFNELQFIQEITGCNDIDSYKIQRLFKTQEDESEWDSSTNLTEESHARALSLGFSEEVISELKIKTPTRHVDTLAFPVLMYGHLLDIRTYNPGGKPKVTSRFHEHTGFIIPYDIWKETETSKMTLICAGEKDMAIARTFGFNAITITGGEQATPKILKCFENRAVAIVYDNDETGIKGARKLASILYKYTKNIRVVTNFHGVCKEKGEDIHDFFMKYHKTKQDLIKYIKETSVFEPTEEEVKETYPIVDLLTASSNGNTGKILQSNIQVVATSEATFEIPLSIVSEKTKLADGTENQLPIGTCKTWELNSITCGDILHLMDNNFKEDAINQNIRKYLLKTFGERNMPFKKQGKKTVYKVYVTDLFETIHSNAQPMEYVAYSIDHKLESGKKYLVTYKIVPHPHKGQQLTMIILDATQASDSVTNFSITEKVKNNLKVIQNLEGSVEEKLHLLTEKFKGILGYDGINHLILIMDLAYHTVLQFNFGRIPNVRGYLDTLIIGESRTGKSSTAEALRNTYGLGTFTSLAGNSATIPGLIGGSNKNNGSMQTRAGVIPQNHMGLIIFEEFGKSDKNILAELTDIRSSNEVRITRTSGSITLPALVRMIALTNVKNNGGIIKSIASYPNGISIVTDLIPTAEDIARYDIIAVMSQRGATHIDPLWEPQEPFPIDVYKDRVRWVWSRTAEQVIIDKDLIKYIVEQCNILNDKYNCHIKFFGTEAWKKISRLSIAIAGYLVSTDSTYEKIIVTKEHVDYAIKLLVGLYDNNTFKLKEYVDMEKKYTEVDDAAISNLQLIFNKAPGLVLQLEQNSMMTKNMLESTTGLEQQELRKSLQLLTRGLFIKVDTGSIIPTERFRLAINQINKRTQVERLGE